MQTRNKVSKKRKPEDTFVVKFTKQKFDIKTKKSIELNELRHKISEIKGKIKEPNTLEAKKAQSKLDAIIESCENSYDNNKENKIKWENNGLEPITLSDLTTKLDELDETIKIGLIGDKTTSNEGFEFTTTEELSELDLKEIHKENQKTFASTKEPSLIFAGQNINAALNKAESNNGCSR